MKVYSLSDRLRNLREYHNLKQQTVASYLHISQQTYSRYESGNRELPLCHLVPLAKLYHVSTDYLLGLSVNQKDLRALSEQICGNASFESLFEDIASFNTENLSLLHTYIDFLKFRQAE